MHAEEGATEEDRGDEARFLLVLPGASQMQQQPQPQKIGAVSELG